MLEARNIGLIAGELLIESGADNIPVVFHGSSMFPILQDGDELSLEAVDWAAIQVGDVITYRLQDKYPTRRVVERGEERLILACDNWPYRLFHAWPEDIIGRVVARTRRGDWVRHDAREWLKAKRSALSTYRRQRLDRSLRELAKRGLRKARRAAGALLNGYRDLPVNVRVNVSSNCNLSCRMCPYLGVHRDSERLNFMTLETFESILPVIKRIGSVVFCGAGDPLFNEDLLTMMEMVRERQPRTRMDLTTNGTMMTRQMAEAFIRLGVDTLVISFDGARPGTVEAIRQGVSHTAVTESIRLMASLKREQNALRPTMRFNYMVGYGTYWELVDIVQLAWNLGVERIQFLEMQPASYEDYKDNFSNCARQDNGATIKEAIKLAQQLNISLTLPYINSNGCFFPYTPIIAEDGQVYPCCFLDYDGRSFYSHEDDRVHSFPELAFGKVQQSTFRNVWNSRAFADFRKDTRRGDYSSYCQTCFNVRNSTSETLLQILGPDEFVFR